jgi:hypothetical protein
MGEKRNAYRLLVGKLEVKRPIGRSRLRYVDNTKLYIGKTGLGCKEWKCVVQGSDHWRAL